MSPHRPSRSVVARSVLAAGLIVLSLGLVSQASGTTWDDPQSIAFPAGTQNVSPQIYFYGASCASEGNCTGVGSFLNAAGSREAFAVASTNGVWGTAHPAVFASGVQDSAPSALFRTVSCLSLIHI